MRSRICDAPIDFGLLHLSTGYQRNVLISNDAGVAGDVVYVLTGIGHGFIIVSDSASVVYLTSSGYSP